MQEVDHPSTKRSTSIEIVYKYLLGRVVFPPPPPPPRLNKRTSHDLIVNLLLLAMSQRVRAAAAAPAAKCIDPRDYNEVLKAVMSNISSFWEDQLWCSNNSHVF